MKKAVAFFFVLMMLTGCSLREAELDRAMTLRAKLLAGSCTFDAVVTADYGDKVYSFSMSCEGNSQGDIRFTVEAPESIAGITGTVSREGGALTFDDTALSFPLLADGQVTPVSAPWILLKTLRGGYLTSANMEEGLLRLTIDDSYEDDALNLDVWLNGDDQPVRADILYAGRRILTVEVGNFTIV